MKTITILGSTGSIGTQALEVAAVHKMKILALCAKSNVRLLAGQAKEFSVKYVCIYDENKFDELKDADWLYVAPLNGKSNEVIKPLVDFAKANDIKICFNAGTTSIKKGYEHLKDILDSVYG